MQENDIEYVTAVRNTLIDSFAQANANLAPFPARKVKTQTKKGSTNPQVCLKREFTDSVPGWSDPINMALSTSTNDLYIEIQEGTKGLSAAGICKTAAIIAQNYISYEILCVDVQGYTQAKKLAITADKIAKQSGDPEALAISSALLGVVAESMLNSDSHWTSEDTMQEYQGSALELYALQRGKSVPVRSHAWNRFTKTFFDKPYSQQ